MDEVGSRGAEVRGEARSERSSRAARIGIANERIVPNAIVPPSLDSLTLRRSSAFVAREVRRTGRPCSPSQVSSTFSVSTGFGPLKIARKLGASFSRGLSSVSVDPFLDRLLKSFDVICSTDHLTMNVGLDDLCKPICYGCDNRHSVGKSLQARI